MSDDSVIYANFIARIRNRLKVVDGVLYGRTNLHGAGRNCGGHLHPSMKGVNPPFYSVAPEAP
jgi:hypothetical protein